MKYNTRILHGAADRDPFTGAMSIPIYPASTYYQKNVDVRQPFDYSRAGNPTRQALEEVLALLENGTHGYAFASGVAAISSAITAVCKAGDHLVVTKDIYGGTFRLLNQYLNKFGITHTFADTTDIESVRRALRPETRVLFLESPSNPLLRIIDFEKMTALARELGLITIMDNTFLSPFFFRPLDWGVDLAVHSATKFLGGHSDLIAGAIMTKRADLAKEVQNVQTGTGNMLSPENSWLLLRGIKTLRARMVPQAENAMVLARWLKTLSWVKAVHYPGLEEHPGHEVIKRQASGFGAVVSIEVDSLERVHALLNKVHFWTVAVSLGGVESILSYPAKMSHASIPKQERDALGVSETLLRLSVGLEDVEDLMEDLEVAAKSLT